MREKQISVDNKGILIFLICIIFSLLALVKLFTEMAVSVYMALSVDRTTEKPRKFCWMSSSWLFLLVSCILVLFILSL